jgi:hypothetical protein
MSFLAALLGWFALTVLSFAKEKLRLIFGRSAGN